MLGPMQNSFGLKFAERVVAEIKTSIDRKQNTDKYKKNKIYGLLPFYKSVSIKRAYKRHNQMFISSFCLPYRKADNTPSSLLSRARSSLLRLRPWRRKSDASSTFAHLR